MNFISKNNIKKELELGDLFTIKNSSTVFIVVRPLVTKGNEYENVGYTYVNLSNYSLVSDKLTRNTLKELQEYIEETDGIDTIFSGKLSSFNLVIK